MVRTAGRRAYWGGVPWVFYTRGGAGVYHTQRPRTGRMDFGGEDKVVQRITPMSWTELSQ